MRYECEATWPAHLDAVRAFAVAPEGRVVSAGDGTLKLWDRTGCLRRMNEGGRTPVSCVAVLTGDRAIAGFLEGTLAVFNLKDGRLLQHWEGHEWAEQSNSITGVAAVPMPPGNEVVVSASADGTLKFWDLGRHRGRSRCIATQQRTGHPCGVTCLAASPDGTVISGSETGSVSSWNMFKGGVIRVLGTVPNGGVQCVALRDDRVISGHRNGHLNVWDLTMEESCVKTLVANDAAVTCVEFLYDGRVACGSRDTVKIFDVSAGCLLETLTASSGVLCLAALPTGRIISGCGSEGTSLEDGPPTGFAQVWVDPQRAMEKALATSAARQRACKDVAADITKFL